MGSIIIQIQMTIVKGEERVKHEGDQALEKLLGHNAFSQIEFSTTIKDISDDSSSIT